MAPSNQKTEFLLPAEVPEDLPQSSDQKVNKPWWSIRPRKPKIANKPEWKKVAEAEVESFRKIVSPFVVTAETTRMAGRWCSPTRRNPGIANNSSLSLIGHDRKEVLGSVSVIVNTLLLRALKLEGQ
jgi:hypothetical protein